MKRSLAAAYIVAVLLIGPHLGGAADATDTVSDSNVLIEGDTPAAIQATALHANPAVARVVPGNAVVPELSAVLTDEAGAPMAGRLVEFLIGADVVCSDVTDGTGEAVCSDVQTSAAAVAIAGYDARFNGTALFAPSAAHGPLAVVNGMPIG